MKRVEQFIDELVAEAKGEDSQALCTFSSFPPTEYLWPQSIDFNTFNVYLHDRTSFESYLARLQTLAEHRPLVLGEFGMDARREGEAEQSAFLGWQIEGAFRAGLAGTVVFSFTDDWFRGGMQIEDWSFGLTDRYRQPRASFHTVQTQYRQAPHFPLPQTPKVSVVVASFNGGKTLPACLKSLEQLRYPNYEVILIDDGSTDNTSQVVTQHPNVRWLYQDNQGLSAARNTGIAAASGDIVAFTDSDCRADEDWLYYLVNDLTQHGWAGIGGHNFLPPDDAPVAAAVMASPGGPAHVLKTDREAEHVPGCNMAFYKWALEAVGGFDPIFRKAGDDVDMCWRLQGAGYKIGFSPAGFVWHYRRSTLKAYLGQQSGYGEAEALLARKHPEYFNLAGGGIWQGRIYAVGLNGLILRQPVIYHGVFGSGFFQRMYRSEPVLAAMLCTSLGYHGLVNAPLLVMSVYAPWLWPLTMTSLLLSVGICAVAGMQAPVASSKRRFWSRPLIVLLFFLQPIVRGWARLAVRLNLRSIGPARPVLTPAARSPSQPLASARPTLAFWAKDGPDRFGFLHRVMEGLRRRNFPVRWDSGWGSFDLEVAPGNWSRIRLTTVTEELEQGKRVFRLRMEPAWSARAWLLFVLVGLMVVGVIGLWSTDWPWVWPVVVVLPWMLWFLNDTAQAWLAALMDVVASTAADSKWIKLEGD